jgi:hypothetical protein
VQGISDDCGVILEVKWEETLCTSGRMVSPVYHKTDILGLKTLLWDKCGRWASNSSCVEEIRNNLKEVVSEFIELFST